MPANLLVKKNIAKIIARLSLSKKKNKLKLAFGLQKKVYFIILKMRVESSFILTWA